MAENLVMTLFLIWLAWFTLGCIIMALIDDDEPTLFQWAFSCPIPFGYFLVVTLWPIVVVLYYWPPRNSDGRSE